jgi:hypothetical protein
MSDLNFSGLRQEIESETSIPEFREVRRRAARHKRWRILLNAARVVGVLVIATPALAVGDVVFTHIYSPQAPNSATGGVAPTIHEQKRTGGMSGSLTRTVVAVDGIDARHTYALVDVCLHAGCNLQLSQVNPDASAAVTQQYGLLRSAPTDVVTDPTLVVENDTTVIVSGIVNAAPRQYQTVSAVAVFGAFAPPPRPIQAVVQGPIRVVSGARGSATTLANQPPVSTPTLESERDGWWVVGTLPAGALAVSVSQDTGRHWSTHGVDVVPDSSAPGSTSLVAQDAANAFLLIRSRGKVSLLHSGDGGVTWGTRATSESWPSGGRRGLIMTSGGALIAWFASAAHTTYLVSTDEGVSFRPLTGAAAPSGPIVSAGGGFVTLGASPMASPDGVTWQSAYVPYVSVSN